MTAHRTIWRMCYEVNLNYSERQKKKKCGSSVLTSVNVLFMPGEIFIHFYSKKKKMVKLELEKLKSIFFTFHTQRISCVRVCVKLFAQ